MARKFQFYRNNFRGGVRIIWGQLRIQGGYLKIRGTGKNSNMRGHTKFLGGLKNRGGKAFRGAVTEGCFRVSWRSPLVIRVTDDEC